MRAKLERVTAYTTNVDIINQAVFVACKRRLRSPGLSKSSEVPAVSFIAPVAA
jgi:hypothetical protein